MFVWFAAAGKRSLMSWKFYSAVFNLRAAFFLVSDYASAGGWLLIGGKIKSLDGRYVPV